MMKETHRPYINIDSGDEIVISGIAGRFPNSNNMNQLQENLFNNIDLSRTDHGRWKMEHPDLPPRMGTINNVEKFDADFFNISFKQAHTLDSMTRILLEHTYEAIVDAGINPKQLQGKNTAVIIGTSILESQGNFMYKNLQTDGLGIIGCSKSTVANMLSQLLDLKGPSYTIDTACSSSLYAIALGYHDIMSGRCEDAIIGTSNLCLNPIINLQFSRLGPLSSDGYCRPFDSTANGYSRSETISVLYLQKAKNAKRIYATCKHIKVSSDGYKKEGITFPSEHNQSTLLMECYKECDILPSYLDYIEAHGTATRAGDPAETKAIYNALCKKRKTPLMIGSVKSNLGHAEAASAFAQIAKAIIAFETGLVPPNINYTSPREDIDALIKGDIHVVTEAMPLKNGYIGINSFGFGGANAHLILKWNTKQKVNSAENGIPNRKLTRTDSLPRLVTLSGRTEESVKSFLNDVANHSTDVEYIRLLHDVYADNIEGHPWRGYIILDTLQPNSMQEIQINKNVKRPIWFIFSALGMQWPQMGQDLLKFHVFENAIKMCDTVLKPYDINIMNILTNKSGKAYENTLHTFVGIVAIQIGLVDLLTTLGITPDYMISHSAGELGCAYADKCLTIEQTILSAYFIGLACIKENVIRSSMAIVNFDCECLKNICPSDIEIACYNSQNSNIISGPAESIKEFVKKLQINNINAEEISCDVYHSYFASVENRLLFNLNQIISCLKNRNPRWISTFVPCMEWSKEAAELSSANYHTHSIFNTVLFEQAINLIPNNAVTIEIGPDGVLQRILRKSLHPKVTNIVLTQRTEQNSTDVTLRGIGKLYNCGLQPQIANLYPPVEFPVSRGTPMISPSIRWDHSKDWFVSTYQSQKDIESRERHVEINLNDESYNYMIGHVIDGRNLLPATGYLALVWETIGMMEGKIYTTIPIIFRDINFIRATHLSNNVTKLTISIQKDSGKFEVTEGSSVVVTGKVHVTSNLKQEMIPNSLLPEDDKEEEHMTDRDIYKELKLRGYEYSGWFRGLKSASISCNKGHIAWINNWVTFMDTMLQLYILGYDTRDLYVPMSIRELIINPALHTSVLKFQATQKDKILPVRIYKEIDAIISGGIEIRGAKATMISRRKLNQNPVIEEHVFVAHHDHAKISLDEAIQISAQLALEDHQIIKIKAIEFVENTDNVAFKELSFPLLIKTFSDMPLIQANITILTSSNRFNPTKLPQNVKIADLNEPSINDKVLIAIGFNLLTKQQKSLEKLLSFVRDGGYVLTRERSNIINYDKYLQQYKLNVILEKRTETEVIVLLKKKVEIKKMTVVYINDDNFNWLEELKQLLNDENQVVKDNRIIIVGERDFECGLLGFINCLRKESGSFVRGVFIQDEKAPKFSLQNPFYMQQLQKDMSINVLRSNKIWGSYRHLPLPRPEAQPVPFAYVCQMVRGDLSTFCWTENAISDSHLEDLIRVVYSSINFRDVMLATGKLNSLPTAISQERFQQTSLGMEYVGFDANGHRVMGLQDNKCIANVVVKNKNLCWDIPDTWSFEDAATVPCVYSTCYFALYICGKMKKGDKILIHSGTGGIGQAAIHLALNEGCEVFTTVGTIEKREFIKRTFPTIMDEHIGNSRDTSFEQMIMLYTNGRGVDIVLNSLAEEKLIASVRCLTRNGRFLEIGKFDLVSNNPLDIIVFQKGISFHGIRLENIFLGYHKHASLISKMMINDLKKGIIKPLQVKVFPKSEIEAAFRYMSSGKHIGKIILKIQEENQSLNGLVVAHRRYYCFNDRSYIILGGLGGFGLELTDWLILRGAKNVVLISRTGIKNSYQRMKVQLWKSYGVNVLIINKIDVSNFDDCEYLLRTAEKMAPVDAIFNLAMVLNDRILKNQTTDNFVKSFKSKAWATQMLDKLSRKICPKLRQFVMFSSITSGKGNAGQTNYGMANSVMERVCEKRAKDGLPGLAIQWGTIGDVGFIVDMQEENKEFVFGGTLQQKISSCLDILDTFLLQNRPIVSSMIVDEKKASSSRFSNMIETVANILNVKDINKINKNTSLSDLGMDSMMVVEIKQILEREFDIFFTAQEIRNLTFAKLIEMSNINIDKDNTQTENSNDIRNQEMPKLIDILKDADFMTEVCLDLLTKKEESTIQVFLIPGIDGCITVFNHLASNIKFSTTSLQYNTNNINSMNTISEIVDYLFEHVSSRLKDGRDFVMVGYSFGSVVAIDLVRRLEAINLKGRLVLIDGAPEQIRLICERFIPSSNDVELQINILIFILEVYKAGSSEKVLMILKECKTWEERFDIFAKHFLAINTLLSPINLKILCTTVYKHLLAIRQYNPSILSPIKSPVMLLKAALSPVYKIEEDYGLHKITRNKVEIHYIENDHFTILRNKKVAAAINGEPL